MVEEDNLERSKKIKSLRNNSTDAGCIGKIVIGPSNQEIVGDIYVNISVKYQEQKQHYRDLMHI